MARSPSDPFFSPKFLASFKICSGIAAFVMIAATQTHRLMVTDPAEREFWQSVIALQPAEVKSIQMTNINHERDSQSACHIWARDWPQHLSMIAFLSIKELVKGMRDDIDF